MSQTRTTHSRCWLLTCLLAIVLTGFAFAGCDSEGGSESEAAESEATAEAAQEDPSSDEETNADKETNADDEPSADEGASANEASADEGSASDNSEESNAEDSQASNDEDLSEGLYPGMKFTKLSKEDRETFVSIAKKELCPCPDAAESLHACLQSKANRCDTATRAAMAINRGLVNGLGESDILDKLATFVDQATTEYEFSLENAPHKGPADAPVTVVEFADFQCPHCKRASQMMNRLHDELGDDVAIYFKHFPLTPGSMAEMAARASEAARRQGKFWPMQKLLFENQKTLSRDKIMRFARRIGLNFGKFKQDLNNPEIAKAVQQDRSEGMEADITGTPAIFINGYRYTGTLNYDAIKNAVQSELPAE
jgi:protein-disulfide isomerase